MRFSSNSLTAKIGLDTLKTECVSLRILPILISLLAIGFNVETVTYKNLKFQVWDLGGQTSIRYATETRLLCSVEHLLFLLRLRAVNQICFLL